MSLQVDTFCDYIIIFTTTNNPRGEPMHCEGKKNLERFLISNCSRNLAAFIYISDHVSLSLCVNVKVMVPWQFTCSDFCARNASSIKCKFPLLTKLTSKREQCRTAWPETYVHQGVQIGFRNVSVRPQKLRAICAESGSVPLSVSTMQSVRVTCTGDIAVCYLLCLSTSSLTTRDKATCYFHAWLRW